MDRKALEEVDETILKKRPSTLKHIGISMNPLVESLDDKKTNSEDTISNDQNTKQLDNSNLHKENRKTNQYEEFENNIYDDKIIACSIEDPESCEMVLLKSKFLLLILKVFCIILHKIIYFRSTLKFNTG